jgi:acyl-CoA synthetase (NDP forming)
VHKFEVKGVILNLVTAQAVRDAYGAMVRHLSQVMPQAQVVGAIVRGMIPSGHEVILGAKRDAVFGPTLMFGLGGLFVEVFKDVTFALAPVDEATADRMIHEVKACSLLQGARGTEVADLKGIRQCVLRLGQLVTDFPIIAEMDINPLLVGPVATGCAVADVRIRLGNRDSGFGIREG